MKPRLSISGAALAMGLVTATLLSSSGASAATFWEIGFSGTFGACDEDCVALGLEALAGTEFSGIITFPTSEAAASSVQHGVVEWPYEANRSLYTFAPEDATFLLNTAVDSFDLTGAEVPNFIINDCIEAACPNNADYFWIAAGAGELGPIFYIPTGVISDTTFPSYGELVTMLLDAAFDITAFDGSGYVRAADLDVSLAERTVGTPVPLPPSVWLLGGAWVLARRLLPGAVARTTSLRR